MSVLATPTTPVAEAQLTRARIRLLRAGYLFMGVGIALVKWPLLPDGHTLPLYEGVTLSMLTAMSLLALLGLWHPVKLLPLLLFESAWKLLWLSLFALPKAINGDLGSAATEVAFSCTFVVVILAVIPWSYVWRTFVRDPRPTGR